MGAGELRWHLALAARTAEALAARYPDDRGAQHLVHLLGAIEQALSAGEQTANQADEVAAGVAAPAVLCSLSAGNGTASKRPSRPKPATHPLRFSASPAGERDDWERYLK